MNERATCNKSGQLGHRWCGICPAHGVPRTECGHPASTSMGSPISVLGDGIAEYNHDAHGPVTHRRPS